MSGGGILFLTVPRRGTLLFMSSDVKERTAFHACALARLGNYEQLSKLIAVHGSWERAWKKISKNHPSVAAEAEWKKFAHTGIALVLRDEPGYPLLLREISNAPWGIYVRGALPSPALFAFAIVGTRNATEPSKELAEKFAYALAKENLAIVSGLALGIDAAAHRGCLDAKGVTVAVVATGLDQCYPRTNEALGARIVKEGGALVSEYPPGVPALPHQFLERNRIVSGLSRGILVVEAPFRSGSHELIRQGAMLVTAPSHILENYGVTEAHSPAAEQADTEEARTILEHLRSLRRPAHIDKIIEATNLEANIVLQTVMFLVAAGHVAESNEGYAIKM